MRLETRCVHAGTLPDPGAGGAVSPIHPATAYAYLDTERRWYPRYFNTPNQDAVVEKLCALEGAEDGVVFSSGMAAISTVLLAFLSAGDHAVIQDEIYGGSHAFVSGLLARLGVEVSFAGREPADFEAACTDRTGLIFLETPTNPLLNVVEIAAVVQVARRRGAVTVLDNTFATPVFQNPLALGVDVSVHSGTKYLGGHSDLCCGAAVASRARIAAVRKAAASLGGSLNAPDAWLLERSLKTLALRVTRQAENAGVLARFLQDHPAVAQVYYPGLAGHPGHETAKRQMSGFGAMLSFALAPAAGPARDVLGRLRVIKPAMSLGGVETTVCDPATTSHAKVEPAVRARLGITDGLLRLSAGIEDADDLTEDLAQALAPR